MTHLERLIAALDREYASRNEGDVEWHWRTTRTRLSVNLAIYDNYSDVEDEVTRYYVSSGPLAPYETTARAVEICAQKILKQMGVASE